MVFQSTINYSILEFVDFSEKALFFSLLVDSEITGVVRRTGVHKLSSYPTTIGR